MGGYSVTCAGFAEMTRQLMSVVPDGRVIAVLEGGYDCNDLAESVAAVLESMLEHTEDSPIASSTTGLVVDADKSAPRSALKKGV